MTREQLEALFDEQDFEEKMRINGIEVGTSSIDLEKVKKYIFEQMIPKVLEEIIPKKINTDYDDSWFPDPEKEAENEGYNEAIYDIKHNAKEKFNIDL